MDTKTHKKPLGRDAVKAALVDASISLFAERGIKAVPIRDIAEQANVNSALIYRHFGSKEGLVEATVNELFDQMAPVVDLDTVSGEEMLLKSFLSIKKNPAILRVLAHLALEGGSDTFKKVPNPFLRETIRKIEEGQDKGELNKDVNAKVLLACSFALGLGWHVFQPMLLEIAGLDKRKGKQIRKEIDEFWFGAIAGG